jgi:hypothetical protein
VSGFRVLVLCCILFVVLYAYLMSLSSIRFVIVLTFPLWCVKVAHFLPFSLVFGSCCFFVSVPLVLLISVGVLIVFGYSEDFLPFIVSPLGC